MADIDKSLPNVEQEIKVPSPEEIEIAQEEEQQKITEEGGPVEVTENEDGSVIIYASATMKSSIFTSVPHSMSRYNLSVCRLNLNLGIVLKRLFIIVNLCCVNTKFLKDCIPPKVYKSLSEY